MKKYNNLDLRIKESLRRPIQYNTLVELKPVWNLRIAMFYFFAMLSISKIMGYDEKI